MSTTQISYFSVTQAEAVTAAQQEEFTNAQLAALQDAGGTVEVDMEVDEDSGTTRCSYSLWRFIGYWFYMCMYIPPFSIV